MKFKTILTIGLLVASRLGYAQEIDKKKTIDLEQINVTSSRSEKKVIDVGRSVTVISNEQIKASGFNTVAELLSQQEGIYVVGTGQNPGQVNSLFMRGANNNQTLIMIDGVRISDPSNTDNGIELNELSIANIDKIEIVRGGHSTLYGSSAIGGVINIITKKNNKPGIHTDVNLQAGTFGKKTSMFSQNALLNYSHKSGFYANGAIYNNNTKGLDATVDTVTNPNDYAHKNRERDNFRKLDLIGKLGYRTNKLDLYASYKNTDQKADIDASAYKDDHANTVDFKRDLFTYGAAYKINDKLNFKYIGGNTTTKRVNLTDSSIVDDAGTYNHSHFKGIYDGETNTQELQGNYSLKGLNLVAGGGFFKERMNINTRYFSSAFGGFETKSDLTDLAINVKTNHQFMHIDINGSVINDDYSPFNLALGIRNTDHSLFGNNISYEINPSLKLKEGGLLYASYATGFNAPSLYQLYSPEKDFTSNILRGNKTLKPETSVSIEFGLKQQINQNIFFSLSLFKTTVENSIDYVYLWNGNASIASLTYLDYRGDTYINIGKQMNQGIELGISSKIGEQFLVSGNISMISGKLAYDPINVDTSHTHENHVQLYTNGAFVNKFTETIGLVRRPTAANIRLTYLPIPKLSITGNVRSVGARSDVYYNSSLGPYGALSTKGISNYTLLDLSGRINVNKTLTAGLRMENVFNTEYQEIYGYTTRGRGIYLNLHYTL
ncbi:TonB-dependent receptor plug domain-containing protein [Pedobacter insulae]|uniref:Outer membrane cobalamin receptor protein n=1 Tax=Pedobacter insulae TaxID=414048 RepID=A0A1I2WRH2_9SPHI|nr:TonB-dependent receptor [Pedobacter insulae]SFH03855.1 Outer membrane cobalamin receptor protein [Pedobacter insulae]